MSTVRPGAHDADLWSTAAHDLRTPLTVIAGYAELLQHRDDEATRRKAAEQILAASTLIASGIDNVLTLLAIAEGDVHLHPVSIALLDVVTEAVGFSPSGESSSAVALGESAPVVRADTEQLARILATLLASARRSRRGDSRTVVTVGEDAGFGVVSLELGEQWESDAGSRLDLHVACRVAELQGGSIAVESTGRPGSRLRLTIPLAESASRSRLRRVMIVDDDDTVRSLLRITLPTQEYEIVEAHRGDEALDLARAEEPDLVLLDWRMPGRSGADVLRELKHGRPDLPIVVLTGATDADSRREAAELGADMFLTKPFSPLELLSVVERLVAQSASQGRVG